MADREIGILKEILESKVYVLPSEPMTCCRIKESGRKAKLTNVEIQSLGANAMMIFPEAGQGKDKRYSPFLKKAALSDHNKACDAVILCTYKNNNYRILCELKSDKPKGADKQFKATLCFLNYLDCILRDLNDCAFPTRITRFIVLNTKKQAIQTINKMPVSPKRQTLPDNEIRYKLVKNGDRIGIGQLLVL